MTASDDSLFIELALKEAKIAEEKGEVPIGAIIVQNNRVIATAHNLKETLKDCTAHAELLAIKKAQAVLQDWRLTDCDLYTTLEPCPMCAGAILHARIKELIYLAPDLKWGAAGTRTNLFEEKLFNHTTKIRFIPNQEAKLCLQNFFKTLREANKATYKT